MRKLVENGPNIYPGANAIEDENGRVIQLNADNRTAREAQAKTLLTPSEMMMQCNQLVATGSSQARRLFKPKIVHRHLHNGDILLINRQPTLHKPSMMAHKARVSRNGLYILSISNKPRTICNHCYDSPLIAGVERRKDVASTLRQL